MATTLEIHTVLNFTQGTGMFGATVTVDREMGKRGLTKGRKLPMLVNNDLVGLFQDLTAIAVKQGGTLEGLAEFLDT